jgi:hypothetical protein
VKTYLVTCHGSTPPTDKICHRCMAIPGPTRANGTYHAAVAQKQRLRRARLLILVGAAFGLLGLANVLAIHNDMTRIEESGPQHLSLAGGGITHFVPSILAEFRRAQLSSSTVNAVDPADPRHSVAFVQDKRALERWIAMSGVSLAVLFVGLESRIPVSTAQPRSPTGTDLSRLLMLVAVSYGALSFFESG